jgi:hypothetical protein
LSFTTSKNSSYNLFHIGRSRDANIIKYDINLDSKGNINTENPIKIYWVRYTDDNKIEGLSYIQNKLAYGVNLLSVQKNEVKFQFVSYEKKSFTIKKNSSGIYKVYTDLKSKQVEVEDIFVQIVGGTFMIPKIAYVKLHWKESKNNKEGDEYIKP